MPRRGEGFGPSPADGWALRATGLWLETSTSSGREPRAPDAEWLKARGQALHKRTPGHTSPLTKGSVRLTGALMNDGGESSKPPAASEAQATVASGGASQ
jgi:hypothetical protein